jgi:hypothetical protein
MKRSGHSNSLANSHRIGCGALGRDDFDAGTDMLDFWRADKNHFEGRVFPLWLQEPALADGAINLTTVGVSANANIESAQPGLFWILDLGGQKNRAGAGAERRFDANKLFELLETSVSQKLKKCAGFPSGNDEAVDAIELCWIFDEHNLRAEFLKPPPMGVEITLQSENADPQGGLRFSIANWICLLQCPDLTVRELNALATTDITGYSRWLAV